MSVRVIGGETLTLRFRAQTPGGKVVRPPASVTVTVSGEGSGPVTLASASISQAELASSGVSFDGRQWSASWDTGGWARGTYQVTVTVEGADGKGIARAEVEVGDSAP